MANKLTPILQKIIDTVENTNQPFDKPLAGGLHVHLRKTGGTYMLTIWRFNTPPSAEEWNTVIAFWPYWLGAINWSNATVTEGGKFIKQAKIKTNK